MPVCPACAAPFEAGSRFCPRDGTALVASDAVTIAVTADPLVGRVLHDRYRLDQRIGAGGMGAVYSARHLLMERRVAVKVLRRELADDATAARRFRREARQSSLLDHPGCVRVTDFGHTDDGLSYLVMEYLEGITVGDEVHRDGPMQARRAVHVAAQIATALAHAHDQGMIHRDLKPDNVMLVTRDGDRDAVKVLDFGLAKLLERPAPAPGETKWSVGNLTESGIVYGTPEFMSPEQAAGNPLDPRSDLYSLGILLFHMVTGELPFSGANVMEILSQHVRSVPAAPSAWRPDLAPALDALILRCLAKRPEARLASARQLADELTALLAELSDDPPRVDRRVAAAATLDLGTAASPAVATREVELARPLPWFRRAVTLMALVAAVAAAAVVVGLARRSADPVRRPDVPATRPGLRASGATTTPSLDAAPSQPSDASASAQATPATATTPRDRARLPAGLHRVDDPELAQHLATAEAAREQGNDLRQQAAADLALRADSSNARAAFLLGEALLRAGDATGCTYLRRARRLPAARRLLASDACAASGSDRGARLGD